LETRDPYGTLTLKAEAVSPSQIQLSWTWSGSDKNSYTLLDFYLNGSSNTFKLITNFNATGSWMHEGLVSGVTYRYRLKATPRYAEGSGLWDVWSNEASATPPKDSQPPSAPTGLTATAVSSSEIRLSWGSSSDNVRVAGYRIEQSENGTTFRDIASSAPTSYSRGGLATGTQYWFRVRAYDGANNTGNYSNTANATTLGVKDTLAPSIPNGLQWTGIPGTSSSSFGHIQLKWSPSTDNVGVAGYDVSVGSSGLLPASKEQHSGWVYTGAPKGVLHYFKVRAYDAAGNRSDWSETVVAVVGAYVDISITDEQRQTRSSKQTVTVKAMVGEGTLTGYKIWNHNNGVSGGGPEPDQWISGAPPTTIPDWGLHPGDGGRFVILKVRSSDGSTAQDTAYTVVDNVPPVASIRVNNGAQTTGSRTVELSLEVSDNAAHYEFLGYKLWNEGESEPPTFNPVLSLSWKDSNWSLRSGPDGSRRVWFHVKDIAGNEQRVNATITLDETQPRVSNITSPAQDKAYGSGWSMSFEVTFSEVVNVTGIPQLTLETGPVDAIATYKSGSATATLRFEWMITGGHNSPDLECVSLALNGGTIKDGAGFNAILTVPAAGATGSLSANKNIMIDTTAPSASISFGSEYALSQNVTLTPIASDNSGAIAQWKRWNEGETEPAYGTGAVPTSWTLPAGDGMKKVYFRVRDAAGNEKIAEASIFLDLNDPAVPTNVQASTTPTQGAHSLNWTASSDGSGSGIASYEVERNGAIVATGITGTGWSHQGAISSGSYTYKVRARDKAGRFSPMSPGAAVIVDNLLPTVSVTPHGTTTNGSPIVFTMTFNEAVTNLTAAGITVTNGTKGTLGGSETVWTIPVTPSANGAVTCKVEGDAAKDVAGNFNSASNTASVTFDNQPPTLSISTPTKNVTNTGPVSFTVTYSAADAVALSESKVHLIKTGTANGTKAVSGSGNGVRTVTISNITGDGTLKIEILAGSASDAVGNQALAAGPSASFTVDNTKPQPPTPQYASLNSTGSVYVHWSEGGFDGANGSGVAGYGARRGKVENGSVSWTQIVEKQGATFLSDAPPAPADGTYIYQARSWDAAGNVSEWSANTNTVVVDTQAPNGGSVKINGDAAYTKTALVTLTITGTGATQMSLSESSSSFSVWEQFAATKSYAIPSSGDGLKTVYVKLKDAAGNESQPFSGAITLDTTAPTGGMVEDGLNGDIDLQPSASAISAKWNGFADPTSGIAKYEWAIGTSATATDVMSFADVGPQTSQTKSGLSLTSGQTYYVHVRAMNGAGIYSDHKVSDGVQVDSQPPTATVTASGSTTNNPSISFKVEFTEAVTGFAMEDIKTNGQVIGVTPNGAVWIVSIQATAQGNVTCRVKANAVQDAAGNPNSESNEAGVLFDSQAPAVPSAPDLDSASDSGASQSDNITKLTAIKLVGTAEAGSKVLLFDGGIKIGEISAAAGTYTFDLTGLLPGTHAFTAKAMDALGNTSEASGTLAVTVDITAPAIPDSISYSPNPNNTGTHTVSWSATGQSYNLRRKKVGDADSIEVATGLTAASWTQNPAVDPGSYLYQVQAVDLAGNMGEYSSNTDTVLVSDAPPDVPILLSPANGAQLTVCEIPLDWTDISGVGGVTYQVAVESSASGFSASNLSSSEVKTSVLLAGAYQWKVRAIDGAGNPSPWSETRTFSIVLAIVTSSLPNGRKDDPYSALVEVTGGLAPIVFSLSSGSLPPGLALSPLTGKLLGIPTEIGTFTFTISVTDAASLSVSREFTIKIDGEPKPLRITSPPSLPNGTSGLAYAHLFEASGGRRPYSWSIKSTFGQLPDGVSFSNGLLSGTPTAGSAMLEVSVTDGEQNDTKEFSLLIVSIPSSIAISTYYPTSAGFVQLPMIIAGTPFSTRFFAGGAMSWKVTSGAPPPGLAIDEPSGAISGIPSKPGEYFFVVRALDGVGAATFRAVRILVAPNDGVTLVLLPAAMPSGSPQVPYSFTLVAAGGSVPYSWAILSGSLPPGMMLNPETGEIFGASGEYGSWSAVIQVSDSRTPPQIATRTITIAMGAAPETAQGDDDGGGGSCGCVGLDAVLLLGILFLRRRFRCR